MDKAWMSQATVWTGRWKTLTRLPQPAHTHPPFTHTLPRKDRGCLRRLRRN